MLRFNLIDLTAGCRAEAKDSTGITKLKHLAKIADWPK